MNKLLEIYFLIFLSGVCQHCFADTVVNRAEFLTSQDWRAASGAFTGALMLVSSIGYLGALSVIGNSGNEWE